MEPILLDEVFSNRGGGYKLVRIYALSSGQRIRIQVNRDFYPAQCYAEAEMFTAERGFVPVLDAPASEWATEVPGVTAAWHREDKGKPALEAISDGLLKRVLSVFSPGS